MGASANRKFTVHLMTSYMTWEGVEAPDEQSAQDMCQYPPEFDINEPHAWIVNEEESEEEEDARDSVHV